MMASLKSLSWSSALLLAALASSVSAGFPPTPQGITTIQSKVRPGVSLSYKQTSICETTSGVKGYSGYVHLPPNATEGRPYNISTFFWFFEARENAGNAPLALWFQGGPGVPSVPAAVGENGPCNVTEDSKTTTLNPFSWNTAVNMLYIDQPVQVGFSYDTLANGTIDEVASPFAAQIPGAPGSALPPGSSLPPENGTIRNGVFSSQSNATTANTTQTAALAIWNFMQTWTQEFPEYKPPQNKLSIWTESYGGHYGPSFADFFESQNDLIEKGDLPGATPLEVETLGIINGCVDALTQIPFYPQMAFNNTYGIKAMNQSTFDQATQAYPKCESMTQQCRSLIASQDPHALGTSQEANAACAGAFKYCFGTQALGYDPRLDVFDIARTVPNSFPPKYAAGYFNTHDVQEALGVPLNFTGQSLAVAVDFTVTGDFMRDGNLQAIGRLLDRGVKVALMYGDRDYQCNWLGGEAVSLALNSSLTKGFHGAGYANIESGNADAAGVVRQYGNLSFSRIFQAGHSVPYFQPEAAYNVFNRVMFDQDVATGKVPTSDPKNTYASKGKASSFDIQQKPPPPQPNICYTWDVQETCTKEQKLMLQNGTAVTKNFILIDSTTSSTTASGDSKAVSAAPMAASAAAAVPKMFAAFAVAYAVGLSFNLL